MFRRIGKNDPCWCGSGKPYCECHMAFDQKISRARFAGHEVPSHKIIKTPAQIEGIRESAVGSFFYASGQTGPRGTVWDRSSAQSWWRR